MHEQIKKSIRNISDALYEMSDDFQREALGWEFRAAHMAILANGFDDHGDPISAKASRTICIECLRHAVFNRRSMYLHHHAAKTIAEAQ